MTESEAQGSAQQPRVLSKRKTTTSKPKVTFKSQTWSNTTTRPRGTQKARTPTSKRASSDPTDSTPVTKRQSRFASLFISLLAVSPMAIEYDAADQKTIEAAAKDSVQPTVPTPPKKAYIRPVSGVRPSEIRKTRWKRFKYEMGLKMKRGNRGKGKERKRAVEEDALEEVELAELRLEERERQEAKRGDMA